MADGGGRRWVRVGLVALVCALVVVPAVVALALDEDEEPSAESHRPRAIEEPSTTTTTPPTTTTLAPVPPPTAPPPADPPPEPPPETSPPPVVRPVPAPAPPPESEPEPAAPQAAACGGGGDVAGLHNAIRCQRGLGGLVYDGGLSANAQATVSRLLGGGSCQAMTHSDLAGVYGGRSWGENLGCAYSSAGCTGSFGEMMGSWMASPGHSGNIVNGAFTRIGYASACDGRNNYFVVHFTS